MSERACPDCLRRGWLLGRLGGHLDYARGELEAVLALGDGELIAAVGGRRAEAIRADHAAIADDALRAAAAGAGLASICRCDPRFPSALRDGEAPPAVLHVAGGLERLLELAAAEPVAIVGARRATPYGIELARGIAAGLAAAGVPVISGMALGIDGAAHAGALELEGPTVAVLPTGADRPYPPAKRSLYRRILARGAAISELAPGAPARRWSFPARNRIIAGLAAATVVVEAGSGSGALLTAAVARRLGRGVGAVPGRVGTAQAEGPNALLAEGAHVVRGAQDVLDLLFGRGARAVPERPRAPLRPELERLRDAIAGGHDSAAAMTRAGLSPQDGLASLAALELAGEIRREPGGRYVPAHYPRPR